MHHRHLCWVRLVGRRIGEDGRGNGLRDCGALNEHQERRQDSARIHLAKARTAPREFAAFLRQIHLREQGLEARVGAVGVEERIDVSPDKHPLALLKRSIERLEHCIHFAGGGVIGCGPVGLTLRGGELPANSSLRA